MPEGQLPPATGVDTALARETVSPAARPRDFLRRLMRSKWTGAAILVVVTLLAFREALFSGRVFYWRDVSMVWYPQSTVFVHCIAKGSWPVWDPFRGFGQPLLADPSAHVLYPPAWLRVLMTLSTYYAVFVVSHYLLTALGMFLLGRRLGLSRAGATTAGLLWVLCGPLLSLTSLYHHLASAAWMPWLVWSLDRARTTPCRRNFVGLVVIAALQVLAGSADMTLLSWIAGGLLSLARARQSDPTLRGAGRSILVVAAGAICVAGVTCIMWLPALCQVSGGGRRALTTEQRTNWSLHPLSAIEMTLRAHWSSTPAITWDSGLRRDLQAPWLPSVYLGLPMLALAAAGAAARRSATARALTLLAALAVLVSLGRYTLVYRSLVALLPPLGTFRFPVKALVLGSLCLALLGGLGVDVWSSRRQVSLARWALWVVAPLLAVLLLCGAGLWWAGTSVPGDALLGLVHGLVERRGWLIEGGAMAGGLAFAALLSRWRRSGYWGVAAALLALFDLMWVHQGLVQLAPADFYRYAPRALDLIDRPRLERIYVDDYVVDGRLKGSQRGINAYAVARAPKGWSQGEATMLGAQLYLNPPTNARWGVFGSYEPDLLGLKPSTEERVARYLREDASADEQLRLLQIAGVTHAFALHPARWWDKVQGVAQYEGLFSAPIRVFVVPDALPRAYVVDGVEIPGSEERTVERLLSPDFDPRRSVLLDAGVPCGPDRQPAGSARILSYAPDRVTLDAEAARAGWLVLVDAYDAGWHATVDGAPVVVHRADGMFRAVSLSAGRHRIELTYRPWEIAAGAATSVAVLLATIIVVTCMAVRARSAREGNAA